MHIRTRRSVEHRTRVLMALGTEARGNEEREKRED